jgi:hypothetical protein
MIIKKLPDKSYLRKLPGKSQVKFPGKKEKYVR